MNNAKEAVGTSKAPLSPVDKVIEESNGHRPNFKVVTVTLTFDGFDPFIFEFDRQSSASVKKLKQDYFDLEEKDRLAKTQQYRVDCLSGLLRSRPKNIIDFPDTGDFRLDFIQFFSEEENSEMLDWLWTEHQAKVYPKEFTSRLFE